MFKSSLGGPRNTQSTSCHFTFSGVLTHEIVRLSVCLSVWVGESYDVHHLVGTGLRCAPPTCVFWWVTRNMQKRTLFVHMWCIRAQYHIFVFANEHANQGSQGSSVMMYTLVVYNVALYRLSGAKDDFRFICSLSILFYGVQCSVVSLSGSVEPTLCYSVVVWSSTCVVHHGPALCTMVHKGDLIFFRNLATTVMSKISYPCLHMCKAIWPTLI